MVDSSPIHLTASGVVTPNSVAGVNALALKNPLDLPMEINEIKFGVRAAQTSGAWLAYNLFGGLLACKLDMGQVQMTNGFVPVWCFGKGENVLTEGPLATSTRAYFEHSFKLAQPLYVPAGLTLTPYFQHRGLQQASFTARISYSGRTLFNKFDAKLLRVPYVTAFVPNAYDPSAAVDRNSLEQDLQNPFDRPLYMQRFIGRCFVASVSAASGPEIPSALSINLTTRIMDSRGRAIVKDLLPFHQVFAGATRSWELYGTPLDPGAYYSVLLRQAALSGYNGDVVAQPFISMVGWHEVPVSAL